MKSKALFIIVLSLCMTVCRAGSIRPELAVDLIPDSLTQRANSVIRSYDVSLTITSPRDAELTSHKIVTILNEKGADELSLTLFYSSFIKLGTMSAIVYDKTGKQLNKHNKSDMTDYAASDGFSLYNDGRVKYLRVGGGEYPVTLDYTCTYIYKGVLDYPDWRIQSPHQSVENATFEVSVPSELDLNYKAYKIHLDPVKSSDKDHNVIYKWSVSGRKAITIPSNSYARDYYLPHIDISPQKFEIGGYKGSLNSWKEYGATFSKAYTDKRKLTDKQVREIHEMVKDAHSDREKAAILYSYLQKNFRYVGIQIGMGGYIPFAASTMDTTRYGDCKALSNYMCAMLNEVGIKAYPTLINAGDNLHPIDTTFPSNKFNHCILYADIEGKPTWLECTDNALPFGELSTFTENRYGLLLTEDGGKIIKTPESDPKLNSATISHEVKLTGTTAADISGSVRVSGQYRPAAKMHLILGTTKEQEKYLFNTLDIRQYENFEVSHPDDSASVISANLKGELSNIYDFKTGTKAFLPSTFIKEWYENMTVDSNNKGHDLILGFPGSKNEKLTYILHDTASISLPTDFEMDNQLISFKRKSSLADVNKVLIETSLVRKKYIVSPKDVALLKESLQKINKYILQKVVIGK